MERYRQDMRSPLGGDWGEESNIVCEVHINYCDLNTIKEVLVLSCNIVIIDDQQL